MIFHALNIIANEMNRHFHEAYGVPTNTLKVGIGNIGLGVGPETDKVPEEKIILTVVNYKEEKTLKNTPNYVRNDRTLMVSYENPPVYINFMILMSATHKEYGQAMIDISRVLRFFQSQTVFTLDTISPKSILLDPLQFNPLDSLESFNLIFDLISPSFEEVNHMWGTLGGKQYPFVLYLMRLLDLKYKVVQSESGMITKVQSEFFHKNPT